MNRVGAIALAILSILFAAAHAQGTAPDMIELFVDASHPTRSLIASEISLPVSPGKNHFWHPGWVPGVAGPTEQECNLVNLKFTAEGQHELTWRRDPLSVNRICVDVPQGVNRLTIKLNYIANQPTRLSSSADCYGAENLVILNFNTCLLYPDKRAPSDLRCRLRLKLPAGFRHGAALEAEQASDGTLDFGVMRLGELIDSPLIAGKYFREIAFDTPGAPPTRFCIVGDNRACLDLSPERIQQLARLVPEAVRLFGFAPFDRYTFLVACTDQAPRFGLEHASSCLVTVRPEALVDDELFRYRAAYLLSHELTHAWCGKYRTPVGMATGDFHTAFDTELLWVYEGLTQYLTQLIAVRSGQVDFEYNLGYLADQVSDQVDRTGRDWRSLADTAIAARSLRGQSAEWRHLRRSQDYYDEGALFWLHIDCLMRSSTNNAASLDDFCRDFFREGLDARQRRFVLDDVVATLQRCSDGPWRELIEQLVYRPRQELSFESLRLAGYRLAASPNTSVYFRLDDKLRALVSAGMSIGLVTEDDGSIKRVREGSAADHADLPSQGRVVAVNQLRFSRQRMIRAIEQTADGEVLELLVRQNDRYKTYRIPYDSGARYPTLERIEDTPDRLRSILSTQSTAAAERISAAR